MKTSYKQKGIGTGAVVAAVVAIVLIIAAAYFIFVPSTTSTTTTSTSTTSTSSSPSTSSSSSSSTSTSTGVSTSTATGNTADVIIPAGIGSNLSLNFQPSALSVTAGTTVTWINQDTSTHNIYFTTMPSGASIPTNPSPNTPNWTNNMYNVTLDVAGTYTYVCQYHSWMTGTIIVTGTSISTTTSTTTSSTTTTTSSPTTTTSTSTSSSPTGATVQVIIPSGIGTDTSLNFQPSSLGNIAPGTTIIFVNQDTSIHDIDFTVQPSGANIKISPNTPSWTNNEYSVTLTVAGSYTFICDYHTWMMGTVTVT